MSLDLTTALKDFTGKPLLKATRDLFKKTLGIPLSPLADSPIEAKRFFGAHYNAKQHADVKAVYLTGRITDESFDLFENEAADIDTLEAELEDAEDYPGLFIFAVDLGDKQLTRSELSTLTRDVNRLFPTPVIVVFKHTRSSQLVLSFGVAERRQHKKDKSRHVMGKVSMIRDIDPNKPHRGHLDLLARFSLKELKTPSGQKVDNFKTFHQAIAEIFNVELLNKQFYRELSNWYFWAMQNCHFPYLDPDTDKYDLFKDEDKVREHDAKNLIRLLTRILFVWFIKEKGLVPDSFFETNSLKKELLKEFNPNSKETNYYKAILQNLFFATLNQTHGKREFRKPGQHQNTTTLLRYEDRLKSPEQFVEIVEATTPFLNGGLFDCLDYPHPTKKGPQGGAMIVYEDGFSDRKDNPLNVPDFLFFGPSQEVDLSDDYGDKKRKTEKVRGLIHILNGYKFTIVENTPVEEEIALDPELLGQVFENLLASYNPETRTTARKQTGSFYTPRPIVDYMVDESLKAHLLKALTAEAGMDEGEAKEKLEDLFTYNEEPNPFKKEQTDQLIRAIDNCKILDPACGSGAFPMGVLHKLVYVLGKLDPRDELWEKRQLAKVDKLIEAAQEFEDTSFREQAIEDAEAQRADIEEAFSRNELGYGRKLYLIENCLYGVDIQSIATQVSKLRFFISLIVDQTVDPSRKNFGIRPLPNLETKFVTANTLIQIEKPKAQGELFELAEVSELQKQLKRVRHDLFSAKKPSTKRKHRRRDEELRAVIAKELKQNGWSNNAADKLAAWDPYDQNASTPYFDPEWMFGLTAFDIVIGNPPYGANIDSMVKLFERLYPNTTRSFKDIYKLFIEAGLTHLLGPHGVICYITPNTLLRQPRYKDARSFLDKFCVLQVIDFGFGIFEQVVPTCVFLATKNEPTGSPVRYLDLTEKGHSTHEINSEPPISISQGKLLDLSHTDMTLNKVSGVILLPLSDILDLKDAGINYQRVKVGMHDKGNSTLSKRLLYEGTRESTDDVEYWKGVDINKYHIARATGRFVRVRTVKSLNANERVVLNRDYFSKTPKLIWRQTAPHLIAALDETGYWFGRSIQAATIKPQFKHVDYFFLLALLNSTYLKYSYNRRVQEAGRVFPQVKFANLKPLMLAIPSEQIQQSIATLAKSITSTKTTDSTADTNILENEIDKRIYPLYGLTPEEVAVIEDTTK